MKTKKGFSIKTIGLISSLIVAIISGSLFASLFLLSNNFNDVQNSTNNYISWKQVALDVKDASDYLTDQVRYYVYNKNKVYMDNYFYEAKVTKRRDNAIEVIEKYLPDTEAQKGIIDAVNRSVSLMNDEYYAMRLIVESEHITMDDTYPLEVKAVVLTAEDAALNDEAKFNLALDKVIGEKYLEDKKFIISNVEYAVSEIDAMMEKNVVASTDRLKNILIIQQILIALNLLVIIAIILIFYFHMLSPLRKAIERLQNHDEMEDKGAKEYRYLASVYNEAREQSNNVKEKLRYEAEHDQLTGLFNRSGYNDIYHNVNLEKCYYILIDVDYFKKVNDKFGHAIGDKVLIKVASMINEMFDKDNEYAFRLGGDEFSVIIEHNDDLSIDQLIEKCKKITDKINNEGNILPAITLSIGIAKGEENDTTDSLFRKADKALYSVKNNGRHNITVYRPDMHY